MPLHPTNSSNRRQFLTAAAGTLAAGIAATKAADEPQNTAPAATEPPPAATLDSPPVLQCPTESTVTVAWAIRGPATGWVEYGPTAQLGARADAPRYGLNPFTDRYLNATITGLKPGVPVYYRTCIAPIFFHNAYKIERGPTVAGETHRYTPPNPDSPAATFALINDTHENPQTLAALTKLLAQDPADLTIWDGDVFNDIATDDQIVEQVLRPAGAAYAASRPVLFTAGNHDHRGPLARNLRQAFIPWAAEEPLGRCFAVRHGPLALIGLDTGEDKPDSHPVFAGLANFEKYHEAQRDWLIAALKRPAIAAARHLVIICHIPLRGLPRDNGGDTLEGYAAYAKHARDLWHPVLVSAKAAVVISGHTHVFRYDAPTEDFPYAQLVGGGPRPQAATLTRAMANAEKLEIVQTKLDGKETGKWTFKPRA
jgi:predicted phosphodiesterase